MDPVSAAPAQARMPPEAPLPMPVQSLRRGRLASRPLTSAPPAMRWRRAAVIGGAGSLTLVAAYQIWWLLRAGGIDLLEGLLLAIFVALFAWIVQSFVGTVAGFVVMLQHRPGRLGLSPGTPLPAPASSTALLVPVYHEDPARVLAGVQAMHESLEATGHLHRFDFFILSDSRDPQLQAAEAREYAALHARLGDRARVWYRVREDNHERKAGNIADWVRRWGGAWPRFLILDADSLMTGETLVRLAAAMERHDDVALIQTLPVIVNGTSLFARMQQFSGRVFGQVMAYGVAWWHGAESNYWGHNAMIRTAAFAAHAGLPPLRGIAPFAGHVLSHDFVEAALLRRGGWALHMVPGLPGSYEEGPPSLTDMLVRDRRWCQGNLQHGGVLPARGLHWVSRWHLLIGIGHYLTAPLWAMLMLVGIGIPLLQGIEGGYSLAGYWLAQDSERFLWVFVLTMSMLLAPKLLGYIASMLDPRIRRGCGGALRAAVGTLLEILLAALMAPVTMYVQSRGVAGVLAGRDSGWDPQRRDDGSLPLAALLRSYGGATALGVVSGGIAYAVSPGLAAWMSPVIAGLALSIPIVMLTSSRAAGLQLRRWGLLCTPEELEPPPLLLRAEALRAAPAAGVGTAAHLAAPG
ncbi:glucans biosynthesis glucosyltransferase MdoH [Luteimonas sp. RD2P54]|uniref:Glucans biosynthesis glucosyltransferase H n=1 Tax=Luteimonas endophytica TaxID=3042023 RepID=A0ABT6J4N4_9GAMM|nr:glucans biosynthesis glucosyltransferase MdoH [Luteimonas endophytica]MDH5821766.1 glucans biosynthesis glucosyltransferase MdoH [Luteimonas endophytica]